ncbi:MAG: S8 family serine peptidase, partial [Pseudomonadota bacterium]
MLWRKISASVGGSSMVLVLGAMLALASACAVDFDEPRAGEDPAGVGRSGFGLSTDHVNVGREKVPDKGIKISENDNSGSKGPAAIGPKKLPPAAQRYIVVLNDVSLEPGIDTEPGHVALNHGVLPDAVYRHAIKGFSAQISDIAKLKRLQHSSAVKYIQPDYRMYKMDQREIPYGRNRIDAELNRIAKIDGQDDNPDTDGIPDRVDVSVAIIDTGIDLDHFDLNVGGGADFVVIDKLSRDGISVPNGGDDIDGHGTHCSGIVGALDNGYNTGAAGHLRAVTGVAPGSKVYSVRVLDANGSGYTSEIIHGIDWMTCCVQGGSCDPACPAGAEDIRVANMSLGCECGTEDCSCEGAEEQAFWAAINSAISAGITMVTSAGNDSTDVGNESSCGATPGCLTNVITVAALTDFDGRRGGLAAPGDCDYSTYTDDTMAGFSNFGAKVELTAPGVCIDSTYPHTDAGYCTHCGAEV